MQAPVASQAVAPHATSLVEQALVQQLPVPSAPQTSDWQLALLVHACPSASKPPPVVPVVPPEELPHAAAKSVRPTAAERMTRM